MPQLPWAVTVAGEGEQQWRCGKHWAVMGQATGVLRSATDLSLPHLLRARLNVVSSDSAWRCSKEQAVQIHIMDVVHS